MSNWRELTNARTGAPVLARAKWCASHWCRLKGLMFVKSLPPMEGLLFVYGNESVIGTSIHMMFMRFTIGVVWLDSQGVVVDKTLAKPWRLSYAPQKAAQYFIEANPDILDRVEIGDQLNFDQ
jgi:uncharacterized membrane protein (UPF0127 family)